MIKKTLGAAFIAGATTLVTQSEPVEPYVDAFINDAKSSFGNATQLSPDATTAASYGLAGILALMGIGAIARTTRRRLEKDQHIGPAVKAQLAELNASVTEALENSQNALNGVDNRVAQELAAHLSSLSEASSKMDGVENTGDRVLAILKKIENSANAHVAINTADGILERYVSAQNDYSEKLNNLLNACNAATQDQRAKTSWYPEFFNEIMGKAALLDSAVANYDGDTEKLTQATEDLNATVLKHVDKIIREIVNKGSKPGYSSPHLSAVSDSSIRLIVAANEIVSAKHALKSQEAPQQSVPIVEQDVSQFQGAVLGNEDFPMVDEDGMIKVEGHGQMYVGLN